MHSPGDAPARAYTCTLHESIADIALGDWRLIVDDNDLAMDRRLIATQERTLHDQCRIWIVLIRDRGGTPAACACLCVFKVDAVLSGHAVLRRAVAIGRRVRPGLLRIGVLFCGLPVPAGESHLRIAPGADVAGVMACLHESMQALARQQRTTLIVHKEFDRRQARCARWLRDERYISGDVPPMHRLIGRFRDFDDYLKSMRSRYRTQVLRSMRKIEAGGFVIERHTTPQSIANAYTPELHKLYEDVWEHSRYKLERLPREFFPAAAEAMREHAALTVIRRNAAYGGAAVGFTFSVGKGGVWHNLYSGVDYSINGSGDILFNLFYADLALAFERGCSDIWLGQTSDAFKSRLGTHTTPLQFLVRARPAAAHVALRLLAPAVFPPMAEVPALHVFKDAAPTPPALTHPVAPIGEPKEVTLAAF